MYKLICPECKGNSYSADNRFFGGCPYCGVQFSGLYGLDKRTEERTQLERNCSLICKEQNFGAVIRDLSPKGLSLNVIGNLPVETNDVINITISDTPVSAKIMWINKANDQLKIGIQRII